jgi:hypothetical protein
MCPSAAPARVKSTGTLPVGDGTALPPSYGVELEPGPVGLNCEMLGIGVVGAGSAVGDPHPQANNSPPMTTPILQMTAVVSHPRATCALELLLSTDRVAVEKAPISTASCRSVRMRR